MTNNPPLTADEARALSDITNDLLEALHWALAEVEGRTVYTSHEQRDNCLDKARAAIAKAERR